MTNELAGLLALDAVYLGIGALALRRLGFDPSFAAAGLALVVGWCAFGVLASFVLMVGGSLGGLWLPGLLLATALVAALAPLPRPARPQPPPHVRVDARWRLLGPAAAAPAGLYGIALLASSLVAGRDVNWDTWAFWLPKAQAIYSFGGLDTGPGGFTSFANPEYPPFAPVTEAAAFHAMGTFEPLALPFQHWVLALAFVGALAALLAPRVPQWLLWPFLAMIVLAPSAARYFTTSLADPQVAYLIALGGVAAALWLLERRPEHLVLGILFLTAAALTKTEGSLLALTVPVALAAAVPRELAARGRGLLALLGGPVVALAAWKVWLAVHDQPLSSDLYDFRDAVRPGHLVDQSGRMAYALEELTGRLLAPDRWLLVLPAAIIVAGLAAARRQRVLSTFVLAWLAIAFLGLASVYWISEVDVRWYVDTSAERVLLSIGFFAGAMTPLLAAETLRAGRP